MDFLAGLGRIAFGDDWISRVRVAEQAVFGNCSAAQAGNRGNPGEQIELEARNRSSLNTRRGGIDSEENQVFAVVAKFYFAESGEAAHKKPGGNEENHRDGDLSDYEDFSRRKTAIGRLRGRSGRSGLQDRREIESCRVQGGNQSKEDGRDHGHAQGETEHLRVGL